MWFHSVGVIIHVLHTCLTHTQKVLSLMPRGTTYVMAPPMAACLHYKDSHCEFPQLFVKLTDRSCDGLENHTGRCPLLMTSGISSNSLHVLKRSELCEMK